MMFMLILRTKKVKALEALEKFGGSLFGGNDGHIPPSFSSAHSAFLSGPPGGEFYR